MSTDRVTSLLSLNRAAKPVAWIAKSRWEQMTAAEPWLTNVVYSEDQGASFPCVPLYADPPGQKPMSLGITKEWFERRAKAEADLEIGAGFSLVNPIDSDIAQMEVLAERALPQWAQDELARLRAALDAVSATGEA